MAKEIYAGVTQPDYSVENGVYPARLFQIIQIGSRRFEKNGKEWYSPQILLGFELPTLSYENMDGVVVGQIKSATYFLSMNPSYKPGMIGLREVIDGLRGSNEYSEEELQKFNIASFLGKMCFLKLDSVESKGQTYQNIAEVKPYDPGYKLELAPGYEQRKEILVTVDDFKNLDALGLPEWIENKIKESKEYSEMENKQDDGFNLPPHPSDDDGIDIDDLEL